MHRYFENKPVLEMTEVDFPRTILEFQDRFGTEDACEKYLFDLKWPDGFECPLCGNDDYYYVKGRRLLECTDCGHQTSLTAGTTMHRTRTPLRKWFIAAYLVSTLTPGISAVQLQRQLGLRSYETAFNMLHKLRAAMVRPDRGRIHGVVEMDETYIGAPKPGKSGRGAYGKVIVAGAIEVLGRSERHQRAGRLRLRIVPDLTARSLMGFARRSIEEGSWVKTDDFPTYYKLEGEGYVHQIATPKEMRHIHQTFGNLKTWLEGTHHGVSKKHLQAYLNEFVFRHNRRFSPMRTFQTILGLATRKRGPTYGELYGAGKEEGWRHPNP